MSVSAGKALVGIEFDPADIAKLQTTARAAGQKASSNFGSNLAKTSRVARTALLGIGVAAGYAVKQAADFQQQLNVLQATSGATASQMKALSDEALKLGADVKLPGTSAQDAAAAMTELSKAGLSLKDTMAAARPVLQLAAAAQISNADAATFTATALNSFSLAGTDASHVADLLAGAANASAGSVPDMAEALKFAGAAAHGAGLSIDETVAAIAEMSNKGISGSVAGSSLAQALRSLQAPSAKSADTMKSLGINIYDAQGNMKSMDGVIKEFGKGFENLTQAQQNQKLATIFGSRAVQAARIVFLGGADAYDKMKDSVSKAGSAQRLAEAQTRGFNGALQGFLSSIQTLAIQLGTALLPAITSITQGLSGFSDVLGKNQSVTLAIIGTLTVFAATVYTVNAAVNAFKTTMIAVSALSNPWVALSLGLVALGGFLLATRDDSDQMTDAFNRAKDASNALKDALNDQKNAHLDVRSTMLDEKDTQDALSAATQKVTNLVKAGKKGTEEYGAALRAKNRAEIAAQRASISHSEALQRERDATAKAEDETKKIAQAMKDATSAAKKQTTGLQGLSPKLANAAQLSGHSRIETGRYANSMFGAAGRAGTLADGINGKLNPSLKEAARRQQRTATAAGILASQLGNIPDEKTLNFYINTFTTSTGDLSTSGRGRSLPRGTPGNTPSTDNAAVGVTHHALGGHVYGGVPAVVGERGPEIFIPGANGSIIPNNRVNWGGGSQPVVNVYVGNEPVDARVEYALNGVSRMVRAGTRRPS